MFCLSKRDLWETLADYPEARQLLTERGCQLLRKDNLLDEDIFACNITFFKHKNKIYIVNFNNSITEKSRPNRVWH